MTDHDTSGRDAPPVAAQPGGQAPYRGQAPICQRCGYELSGLTVDSHCPECAAPVWQSGASRPSSGFAVTSMVLGIVSLVLLVGCWPTTFVLGPLSLIFGGVAYRHIGLGRAPRTSIGMVRAGLICGSISTFLCVALVLFIVFGSMI